jgi:hypothetical protein
MSSAIERRLTRRLEESLAELHRASQGLAARPTDPVARYRLCVAVKELRAAEKWAEALRG